MSTEAVRFSMPLLSRLALMVPSRGLHRMNCAIEVVAIGVPTGNTPSSATGFTAMRNGGVQGCRQRCRNVNGRIIGIAVNGPCRCGLLSPPLRLCREMSEALLWGPCVGCARGRSRDRRQAALLAKLREQRPDLGAGTASARY